MTDISEDAESLKELVSTLCELRRELDATRYAARRSVEAFGTKWPREATEVLGLVSEALTSSVELIDATLEPHEELVTTLQPKTYPADKDVS